MSITGTPNPSPAGSRNAAEDRLPVAVLSVLALLQAVVVLLSGGGIAVKTIAIGLAIASVFVRLRVLVIFAGLIAINFIVHLVLLTPSFPYRVAHVAILAAYGATALAGLAAMVPKVRFAPALAVASLLAMSFVAAEALIPRIVPPSIVGQAGVIWMGRPRSDPSLEPRYTPYAILQTVYPDNPRGYFEKTQTGESSPAIHYSVTYSLNALGCRGRDYSIPKPPGRHRILVLGNSSALGVGVHEHDTFPDRLERSLNAASQASSDHGYDVINCGARGYSTREQRVFYEQIAFRYEPDVVLVSMSERDNLSSREERQRGFVHESASYENLLLTARLIQYARHEGRRPFEYSGAVEELAKLNDACRVRGARLAVVIFRNVDASPHWRDLVTAVSGKLQPLDIPVLDLGLAILKEHQASDLSVHPLDENPNEVAHRVAADEIERLLRRHGMIG
jgi:hypothetical protein